VLDCRGCIVAPGFIDLQINGAFGVDFSCDITDRESGENVLRKIGQGILAHGVTAYCPTVVTSPPSVYSSVLPNIPRAPGGLHGAAVLGVHVEGPFISLQKKGAHPEEHITSPTNGIRSLDEVYGDGLENVALITLAPELEWALEVIEACVRRGIVVSVGHTMSTISQGEEAVRRGARLVTHLFNAMQSFHHRDPGLVGLLTSEKLANSQVWCGIIADGVHTHPASIRIAYKTNFKSLVLVTDAILAMGYKDGKYQFGQQEIEVRGDQAWVAGTSTLTGSVATMQRSVTKFLKYSRCSLVEALEVASLHPARALGVEQRKGTLNVSPTQCRNSVKCPPKVGADADFILLEPNSLEVCSTWIAGQCVFERDSTKG